MGGWNSYTSDQLLDHLDLTKGICMAKQLDKPRAYHGCVPGPPGNRSNWHFSSRKVKPRKKKKTWKNKLKREQQR